MPDEWSKSENGRRWWWLELKSDSSTHVEVVGRDQDLFLSVGVKATKARRRLACQRGWEAVMRAMLAALPFSIARVLRLERHVLERLDVDWAYNVLAKVKDGRGRPRELQQRSESRKLRA